MFAKCVIGLAFLGLAEALTVTAPLAPRRHLERAEANAKANASGVCSAAQEAAHCCAPIFSLAQASNWQTTVSAAGAWTINQHYVRYDFANSKFCGGDPNLNAPQAGTATTTFTITQATDVYLQMEGIAESQYETFVLMVDGVMTAFVQAHDAQDGPDGPCLVSTCSMCYVSMPSTTFHLSAGSHTIQVQVDSIDEYYHKNAYFAFSFSQMSAGTCNNCNCPVDTSTATGDPHLQNIIGERFDLLERGKHVLVQIPRGAAPQDTLLRVEALVGGGKSCNVSFIQGLNITGAWADEQKPPSGFQYTALPWGEKKRGLHRTRHQRFGPITVRISYGIMQSGYTYLNFNARDFNKTNLAVGGLLGEDDHTNAASKERCLQDRLYTNMSNTEEVATEKVDTVSAK